MEWQGGEGGVAGGVRAERQRRSKPSSDFVLRADSSSRRSHAPARMQKHHFFDAAADGAAAPVWPVVGVTIPLSAQYGFVIPARRKVNTTSAIVMQSASISENPALLRDFSSMLSRKFMGELSSNCYGQPWAERTCWDDFQRHSRQNNVRHDYAPEGIEGTRQIKKSVLREAIQNALELEQ